jgi:hypothetical protein
LYYALGIFDRNQLLLNYNLMTLIPQKLIEKALALTSKTIEDMYAGNI